MNGRNVLPGVCVAWLLVAFSPAGAGVISGQITDDLLLNPEGSPVSLIHPRKWRVISNHASRTILRYSQKGRAIGQCDIIPLPNRLPDQDQTLEQFRSVVKDKLTDSSGEIKSANQARTSNGLEWMRVEATGAAGRRAVSYLRRLSREGGADVLGQRGVVPDHEIDVVGR